MCVICAGGVPVCSVGPLCSIENVHQILAVGSVMSGWGVVSMRGMIGQWFAKLSGKKVSKKLASPAESLPPKGS
jgi:hypothetical protein